MAQLRHDHRRHGPDGGVELGLGRRLPPDRGQRLANNGALNFYGNASDALTVSGGTFTGNPPTLRQGSLALTGGTGVARIQYGQVSLATDVAPGWTIRIEDRGSDTTRLRIPAGATRTNTGTIVFAADPVPGSNERVSSAIEILGGGTLINTGTIRVDADSAGPSTISAVYASGQSYLDPAAFKQNGTLDVRKALVHPALHAAGRHDDRGRRRPADGRVPAAGHRPGPAARGRHDHR